MASTKAKWNKGSLQFYSHPMMLKGSTISENEEFDSTAEAAVFTSDSFPASFFNSTDMHFRLTLAGHISSDSTDDITFVLKYNTTVLLNTIVTSALPNEQDYAFRLEYVGRIHTTGASGKIVCHGSLTNEMTAMADIHHVAAVGGAAVGLTTAGTLNVTADWSDDDADTDIFVQFGLLELFN